MVFKVVVAPVTHNTRIRITDGRGDTVSNAKTLRVVSLRRAIVVRSVKR